MQVYPLYAWGGVVVKALRH